MLQMDSSGSNLRRTAAYQRIDDIELGSQPKHISPTHGIPVRMVVQATKHALESSQSHYHRVPVKSNAPIPLKLSSWALGASGIHPSDITGVATTLWRVAIVTPLYFIILLWPFYPEQPVMTHYSKFPSKSQDYPKYASNKLDASPNAVSSVEWNEAVYDVAGEQKRLILPRQLVVKPVDRAEKDGRWILSKETARPYIVISYTAIHMNDTTFNFEIVERLAERMAQVAGVDAYWVDYKCRAKENPELTDDIHRICDVFRGASQVVVLLPDLSDRCQKEWGERMWTLTEVLLSTHDKIKFVSAAEQTIEYTKMEISSLIWTDSESTRFLAEHYSSLLTLSRLELISLGLTALSNRKAGTRWTDGDVAYALMALLRYRPRMNPTDTLFQALARLSLANDSDRIVERMVCMFPDPTKTYDTSFVLEDCLGANLWDIEPLCQIAGIGEKDEVIIDGCLAISIRWKDTPRIHYVRQDYWKKFSALFAFRAFFVAIFFGASLLGISAAFNLYGGVGSINSIFKTYRTIGAILIAISVVIAISAPWLFRLVYGGKIREASPWLIGFEGTLPIHEIERITFGSVIGRLSYAFSYSPPSNPIYERDPNKRIGKGPSFIENTESHPNHPVLPKDHRLFTLIDTGTMTVTVFSALKPPSVALICGKEGGMLRVVLCSFEESRNCLHKETVLKLETPMMDQARRHTWLKLDLSFLNAMQG